MRAESEFLAVFSILAGFGCGGGQPGVLQIDPSADQQRPKQVTIVNTQLVSLDQLGSVLAIEGDLRVVNNESLVNCHGLGGIRAVGRDFILFGNPKLANLRDLGLVG